MQKKVKKEVKKKESKRSEELQTFRKIMFLILNRNSLTVAPLKKVRFKKQV